MLDLEHVLLLVRGEIQVQSQATNPLSPGTITCSRCGTVNLGSPDSCSACGRRLPKLSAALHPGDVIHGKYEVLDLLGVGGMGEVYKVRHTTLDAIRCVKLMKKNLLSSESMQARFLREARIATRIQHPNVAMVHDFDTTEDGSHYLVTEFIDGITVHQWMRRHGRFPVDLAIFLVRQVLSGLGQIHSRGLLHRDISADNVMLTIGHDGNPAAKIIDLGIAKVVEGPAELSGATQAGMFVGNPRYASPEQLGWLGEDETIDQRADLYCLGVVLYEMITGDHPLGSGSAGSYVASHLTVKPRQFAEIAADVSIPAGLEEVVFRALEKTRELRYGSAAEFSAALGGFVGAGRVDLAQWAAEIESDLPSTQVEALLREVTPPPAEPRDARSEPEVSAEAPEAGAPAPAPVEELPRRTAEMEAPPEIVHRTPPRRPVAPPASLAPSSPSRRPRTGILVSALALVVIALVVAFEMTRRGTEEQIAPPTPVAPSATAGLAIDATPWAMVTSVRDGSGRELLAGGFQPTPLALLVPPGKYTVSLSRGSESKTAVVTVKDETPGRLLERLGTIDVVAFLKRLGNGDWIQRKPVPGMPGANDEGEQPEEEQVADLRGWIDALSVRAGQALDGMSSMPSPPPNLVIAKSGLDQSLLRASVASRVDDIDRLKQLGSDLANELDSFERIFHDAARTRLGPPVALELAARSYFEGRYQETIDLVKQLRLDGADSIALSRLLSGAAKFALYRLGGAKSLVLRSGATEDVRACAALRPDLQLDGNELSPAFIEFYSAATGGS